MTAYMFYIDSMVRSYHDYQSTWDNPMADGDLPCEWETGNSHDLQAVARLMIPYKFSGACQGKYLQFTMFLRRSGSVILTWDFIIDA